MTLYFDKLIDRYIPTDSGWNFHPDNTASLSSMEIDGKLVIEATNPLTKDYKQLMYSNVSSGGNATVYYLDMIASKDSGTLPKIVRDPTASNARAIELAPETTMIFRTNYPYNKDRLKKILCRCRKAAGAPTLHVGVIGIEDKAYKQPDGTYGNNDFYEVTVSGNITESYVTYVGYIADTDTVENIESASRPNNDPDYPAKLLDGTTDIALMIRTGSGTGSIYIDSIELQDTENALTELPRGAMVVNSLEGLTDDNKLSPVEKTYIKTLLTEIDSVYLGVLADGTAAGVNSTLLTALTTKYTALHAIVDPLLADMTRASDVTSAFDDAFSEYYDAKTAVQSEVSNLNSAEVELIGVNVASISTQVQNHGSVITGINETLQAQASAISNQISQMTSVENSLESHTTQLENHQDALNEQAADISTNTNDISTLVTRVTSVEGVNTTQGTAITQTAEEISSLASRVTTAEGTISSQGTLITQNAGEISSLATSVNTAISDLEEAVDSQSTLITQNAGEISSLASRVTTAEGTISSQGTLITQTAEEISSLAGRVDETDESISTLGTLITQTAEEISSLASRVDETDESISTLGTLITQTAEEISSLATSVNTDISDLEEEVNSQSTLITQTAEEISSLAGRVDETDESISTLGTSVSQQAEGITLLAGRVDETETLISSNTSSISQNADAIELKVEAIDTNGNGVVGAKIEIGSVDGAGQIKLDADRILLSGSVKADKIDVDDLMTKELVVKNQIKTQNNNVIISSNGSITAINATLEGGTFTGSVEHPSFKTVVESAPSNPISIPSKTRWRADYLYNALSSVAIGNTWKTASGSYLGKSVNAVSRISSRQRLILASTSGGSSGDLYDNELIATITVPKGVSNFYFWFDVDHQNGYGYIYATKNKTASTYKDANLWSKSTSDYTSGTHDIYTTTRTDVVAGDVIRVYAYRTALYGYNFQVQSAEYDKGTFIRTTDGEMYHFFYGGYYTSPVSITSPNSYTSAINYVLASSVASMFSTYGNGGTYRASGTLYVDGTSRTVTNLMRDGSSITFYFTSGNPAVLTANDSDGATYGSYDVSGSVTVVSQEAGIIVKSITPMVNSTDSTTVGGTDIGNGSYKVRNITGAGNIAGFNSISATTVTATTVWGAVAN